VIVASSFRLDAPGEAAVDNADSQLEASGKSGRDGFVDSHARVATRLALLVAKVTRGESDGVVDLCSRVSREVRGHLSAEEEFLLPKFRALHADEAMRLDAEHDSIRELLAEIDSEALGGAVQPESLNRLRRALVDHGNREKVMFYPWAQDRFLGSVWVKAARFLSPGPSPGA
jgi:hypothetical protein